MDRYVPQSSSYSIAIAVLTVALMTPLACSSDTPAQQSTAPAEGSVSEAPAEAPSSSVEDRYIDFIREEIPGASDRTDAQLISGGKGLCRQLDNGVTMDQLAIAASLKGFDIQELGFTTVAAVNSFCPQHRDLLDN